MPELRLGRGTYHGGFSFIPVSGVHGGLVLDDDALRMVGVQNEKYTRELPPMEMCRTRAIAAVEVTSEQVAKSKVGAALVFGVLGGVTAKGSMDRATLIVYVKSGEKGYFTIPQQSVASLLGTLEPWMRDRGINLGSPEAPAVQATTTPKLIADELLKLAQLRDSGVLSEDEFLNLKARLIQDHTGATS